MFLIAIPDEEGDTILWRKGENAITKADGMGFMRDLSESDRTVMRDGTWLTEIFYDD